MRLLLDVVEGDLRYGRTVVARVDLAGTLWLRLWDLPRDLKVRGEQIWFFSDDLEEVPYLRLDDVLAGIGQDSPVLAETWRRCVESECPGSVIEAINAAQQQSGPIDHETPL